MSSSMSNSMQTQGLASLSLKMDQETKLVQKQGIVTILGFESERARATASSLRRTLSADLSSKRWLDSQNGFYPMKKIASSEQLSHPNVIADSFSSSEGEDDHEDGKEMGAEGEIERGQFDIWSSIQQDNNKEQEKAAGQFYIWSSIISQKANDDDAIKSLPNYVHPLVKRSQSSLNEKSLEICTESLGSETGSDGFSYPPSETGDAEEDKEEEQQEEPERVAVQPFEAEECLPKYNYSAAAKKSPPRSFPPPLSSLSRQAGPSLHMRSRRDNGRLVLEAVSVPCQNNFRAQRQDGRLVLSFANLPNHEESKEDATEEQEEHHMEDMEEEFGGDQEETEHEEFDDDESETEEEEVGGMEIDESDNRDKIETVTEQAPILSRGIAGVHRLAMMMNKPVGLVNTDPKWSKKFNKVVEFEDVEVAEPTSIAKSLPPRPRVARLIPSVPAATSAAAAAAASLNAYEYYWRTKPTPTASPVANPLTDKQNNSYLTNNSKLVFSKDINQTPNEQQQLVVLRGKNGDYLVHKLKSCKESRRSLLFWEPYCIATS
ncbi:hypothetical protein L6164_022175 [Bauhinia variegata]|uniref:Uncharacterized protein n=1 Tax=Bauhinia variegata TaxID=167791 RepID=A0ACB9MFC2_BAUVA|nr:hypothetical protein L6164_022175 [Bauhinia variegata]